MVLAAWTAYAKWTRHFIPMKVKPSKPALVPRSPSQYLSTRARSSAPITPCCYRPSVGWPARANVRLNRNVPSSTFSHQTIKACFLDLHSFRQEIVEKWRNSLSATSASRSALQILPLSEKKPPQKNNKKPRKSFTVHQVNRKSTFLYLSSDVGKIEWQRTKIKFLLAKWHFQKIQIVI